MASGTAFFKYVETIAIGGDTFYGFSVSFGHKDWMDVVFPLTGLPDELLPLLVIDIPTELPSIIAENTEIDDSFTAPADLYYAFTRALTFHEAAEPDAPALASVIISQALLESCVAYYVDRAPDGDMVLPGDNDPSDYEPDDNGWYYPPFDDFDFKEVVEVQRSVGFQTASLNWLFSWLYDGCEDMDADYHVMETLDDATFNTNGIYTWSTANYINCCNAGVDSGYRIVEGGSGGSTYVSIWLFAPETDVARHYAANLLVPVARHSPLFDILIPVVFLLSGLHFQKPEPFTQFLKGIFPSLKAKEPEGMLGIEGVPIGIEGSALGGKL